AADCVSIGRKRRSGLLVEWHGKESRVINKGMTSEDHRYGGVGRIGMCQIEAGGGSFDQTDRAVRVAYNHLGKAVVTRNEVAISVGCEQGNVTDIVVGENDAELQRIGLDVGPSGHARVVVGRAGDAVRALRMVQQFAA